MDYVLLVQFVDALYCLIDCESAEILGKLALQFLDNWGKGTAIHELQNDPKSFREEVGLFTLNDGFAASELHNPNFINYVRLLL